MQDAGSIGDMLWQAEVGGVGPGGVGPDGNLRMLLGYLVCPLLFSKLTIFSLPVGSELCCQPLKASLMLKSYAFGT